MTLRRLITGLAALGLMILAPSSMQHSNPAKASNLAGHSDATETRGTVRPTIAHPVDGLFGTWTNTDITTRHYVRIVITPTGGDDINVHVYGACKPTPCDWESTTGTVYAPDVTSPGGVAFTAIYTFDFEQVIVTGILENPNLGPYLDVQSFTKFTDKSWRSNYYSTERFTKAIERVKYKVGPQIPHPHVEGAGMVLGNRLFVITGSTTDCTDGVPGKPTPLVDIYDPISNSFSAGSLVHFARDGNPLAAVASTPSGPRGYLIGGMSACGGATTVRTVEEYNPALGYWAPLPGSADLPAGLDGLHHCGAALRGKIYYFQAGKIGVFDAASHSWSIMPAPAELSASNFCKAVVINSNLIMITGPGNGSADANSQRILLFAPSNGSIREAPTTTLPMAEHGMGYMPIYGQTLVAGGDFAGKTAVQSIGPANFVTNATPLPMTWDDGVSAVLDTASGPHLYLAGGMGGGSNTPQVIIATPAS